MKDKKTTDSSSQQQEEKILVPQWFWRERIEQRTVPQHQIEALVQESGFEPNTPLSTQSKLSPPESDPFNMGPEVPLSEADRTFFGIFNAARQHRLAQTHKFWTLPSSMSAKGGQRQTKTLKASETQEPPIPVPDYEVLWRFEKISYTELQMKSPQCQLAPADVMLSAIRNYWFDDLEILVESQFLHVDRFLFTYFAKNFRTCKSSVLQIPVSKVDMCMLRRIYDWMLGNEQVIQINRELIPFFKAAKFLGIDELVDHYRSAFSRSPSGGVWEQNALRTYLSAGSQRCEEMMIMMLSRVRKCFLPLVAAQEFLELNAQEMVYLLRLKTICVNGEEEVFFACLRWLEHAWEERQQYVFQLMSNMHVSLLPAWLLRSLDTQCDNQMIAEVFRSPDFQDWLFEKIKESLAISASMESARNAKIIEMPNIEELERSWVYCGVPHHHDSRCPNYRQLNYRTFKLFLQRLQQQSETYMESLQSIPNRAWNSFPCCPAVLTSRRHKKRT
ncbi:GL15186 [Drosophila persimilis]|uniref:GL15186 n=1 Tax=Drosophila persimilis TaxID=7234 RepID=B4GPU5_DROPE|nr:uncharacterized protein LOC6595519 [Drosophila persimilis]EDW39617.1 GL15186 [Drosophila persimilis]